MNIIHLFLILATVSAIASLGVLSNDISLALQSITVWDTVEDFADDPNDLGFSCQCAEIVNGEITDPPNYSEDFCDMQDGPPGLSEHGQMICEWEIHLLPTQNSVQLSKASSDSFDGTANNGYYGNEIGDEYYGDGCNVNFWILNSIKPNYLWPAEYKPQYKFNEIFSTDISISPINDRYGKSEDGLTPFEIKQQALELISDLNTSDDAKKIIKDIHKKLKKNLDDKFWIDESHIISDGNSLLQHDEQSVRELVKLIKEDKENPKILAILNQFILDIITSNKVLAETAYYEIEIYGQTKHVTKAYQKIIDAQDAMSKKDYRKAMESYHESWKETRNAMEDLGYTYDGTPTLLNALHSYLIKNPTDMDIFASQSVSALLNAGHASINYPLNVKQILAITPQAIYDENYEFDERTSASDLFKNLNSHGGKFCEYDHLIVDFCDDCENDDDDIPKKNKDKKESD